MDKSLLIVLGLSLLPALGNIGGGVLAECLRPSPQILNRGLHAASFADLSANTLYEWMAGYFLTAT